jgi:PAS domain S-box-containing protein
MNQKDDDHFKLGDLVSHETRFQLMSDCVTDYALIIADRDRLITDWSVGAETIFGWKPKEVIGKTADIIFTPEDRADGAPDREFQTAVMKGRANDERWHQRKDGSAVFVSGVMTALYEGKILIGLAKIARDLTLRRETDALALEREMLRRLNDMQEADRKRIASNLHDHLGQQFTALRLRLRTLRDQADVATAKVIGQIESIAEKMDRDVSFIAWELRPESLDELGLRFALNQFVLEWSKYSRIEADFHTPSRRQRRLIPEIEINLYRIAQEALNNVLKHSKATKVTVTLEFNKQEVVLAVEDNGIGFNPDVKMKSTKRKRLGLSGMRERAALAGGTLAVESTRGKGTTVIARIPIRLQDAAGKQKRS